MKIGVVALFPELVNQVFNFGVNRRARQLPDFSIEFIDLREYGLGPHKKIDDSPFGGGSGMVLQFEPLANCIRALRAKLPKAKVLLSSASGVPLKQSLVKEFAQESELILVAGRYEGVDERLVHREVDLEFSVGEYILSGGELALMVLLDSLMRLLPGVLGNQESLALESYSDSLLEYPQYTRPQEIENLRVPEVLLKGNHSEINQWRREQMLKKTLQRNPALLKSCIMSAQDQAYLSSLGYNQKQYGETS
ncbi:MAG: tRNA (guanosine(37)-N1)-methyltransferase TrmD [Methylacidiphilales bacterium]|nr:tRNA (guanosine(37)-N1)-methyltransferase TrmD [Candidatus Methylacidiphilales bacterium]